MEFQILISTMNKNKDQIQNMLVENNICSSSVIINQSSKNDVEIIDNNKYIYTCIEKGLSKSRNKALSHATSDICLIADDDIYYNSKCENTILEAFEKNPEYDIIAFFVNRSKDFAKKKKGKKHEIHFFQSLGLISIQIAFKRKSINDAGIRFDERFGSGSGRYICGEENIFLIDCLKKGLKILYVPEEIAILTETESTWFKGYNEQYFKSKGAIYYRMSDVLCFVLIIVFAISKWKMYASETNFFKAIKWMFEGCKECKEINNEN